jgi:hypothetical protein
MGFYKDRQNCGLMRLGTNKQFAKFSPQERNKIILELNFCLQALGLENILFKGKVTRDFGILILISLIDMKFVLQ